MPGRSAERKEPPHPMPIIDPAIALSTRQEAFRRYYYDKT